MTEASEPILSAGTGSMSKTGRLTTLLYRHEALRGYVLMSPTLIIMMIGIAIPFLILIAMSFWTRDGT
jgi:spermidine/putrescine transport system permease protein